jgi:spore coat polysaccharide biosynthesis protein SpsF (cytidylyltransferase family)
MKYAVVFHGPTVISALACDEEISEYVMVDLEDTKHFYPIVMFTNKCEAKNALENFCYNDSKAYKCHEIVTEEVLKLYLAEDKLSRVA